ncbi:MAG: acetyl-CoA carboxylase carboxyl transferase subunit beta [Armatimonadetes bacterium]|nr:acetyl-CoA carboxylase carboxyl transferase subunit beta [Armatimonadota bacterium]
MTSTREQEKIQAVGELWEECPGCHQLLYVRELEKQLWVCSRCGYHFRLSLWQRLQMTIDQGTFEEWDHNLPLHDPLNFPSYREKLEKARRDTGATEAILTGRARIEGIATGLGIMDLAFIGGSMGWVVGERVARLFERCAEARLPAVIFCASGGARMQESLVSLMQMPKTAAAAGRLRQAGQLYISVLTDPTYGGVTASYAFLGDIIIAEPNASIGFAGPRVVEVTGMNMPPHVQKAEFHFSHGMIDLIVPRSQLREILAALLRWATAGRSGASQNGY